MHSYRVIGNEKQICCLEGLKSPDFTEIFEYQDVIRSKVFQSLLHPQVEWSNRDCAQLIRDAAHWKLAGFRTDDLGAVADTFAVAADASEFTKEAAALYRLIGEEETKKFRKAMKPITRLDEIDYVYASPGSKRDISYHEIPPRYYFRALQSEFNGILSPDHCEEICGNDSYSEIYEILDRLHIPISATSQTMIHERIMAICKQVEQADEQSDDQKMPEDHPGIMYGVYAENLPDLLSTDPIKLEKALLRRRRQ